MGIQFVCISIDVLYVGCNLGYLEIWWFFIVQLFSFLQDVNRLEEEKEIEEPDRLSELLPNSRFNCNQKNTGYYADQDLGCEVFHYCQENIKHSWICPEGFTFHQVGYSILQFLGHVINYCFKERK